MKQQISMEAGLAACRERLGELTYENVLLRATVTELEAENERLRTHQPDAQSNGMPPSPEDGSPHAPMTAAEHHLRQ